MGKRKENLKMGKKVKEGNMRGEEGGGISRKNGRIRRVLSEDLE